MSHPKPHHQRPLLFSSTSNVLRLRKGGNKESAPKKMKSLYKNEPCLTTSSKILPVTVPTLLKMYRLFLFLLHNEAFPTAESTPSRGHNPAHSQGPHTAYPRSLSPLWTELPSLLPASRQYLVFPLPEMSFLSSPRFNKLQTPSYSPSPRFKVTSSKELRRLG